jgi:phytoene dehydrogenase-like protein
MGTSTTRAWDAVIIGGGHNGLVCAAYLARGGRRVLVLERRAVVGGAAVTEEFHPGFRNSVAAYTVSLLQPRIIQELDLAGHGLRVVPRRINNFLPLDGDYLLAGAGLTRAQVARFSTRDAERLPVFEQRLEAFADVLRELALQPPPNVGEGHWLTQLPALWQAGREYLDRWFESDPIKALFGFDGIVGNYASPDAPGSAYVLLHHAFGESNGVKGAWGHAIGGMGAITQAMARAATAAGAEIRTDAGVRRVLVEHGHAVGVETLQGERSAPARWLPTSIPSCSTAAACAGRGAGRHARTHGALALRLRHLPHERGAVRAALDFSCLPGSRADHLTSGIIIAPTLQYMERAYNDARAHGWSREPIVELLIPSDAGPDPGAARPARGQPVLPARGAGACRGAQLGRPSRGGGRPDDRHRGAHAPNFAELVLGRQI